MANLYKNQTEEITVNTAYCNRKFITIKTTKPDRNTLIRPYRSTSGIVTNFHTNFPRQQLQQATAAAADIIFCPLSCAFSMHNVRAIITIHLHYNRETVYSVRSDASLSKQLQQIALNNVILAASTYHSNTNEMQNCEGVYLHIIDTNMFRSLL
jgi:hypothetical protein